MIAETPKPPYYVVIFTSIRTEGDNGYSDMGEKMIALAKLQDGFLGLEAARSEIGITVSYWRDLESIKKWKAHSEHKIAQTTGRQIWYKSFKTRIALVESDYDFHKK
jgi:heme-degrading monooxygenase HmoA